MIPPGIHPGCQSQGEKEVFARLRDDPDTRDWIVLHSLDVARHEHQIAGEIDFVVVIPGLGVLCVEVKGCSRLRVEDGCWYYGADPKPDTRGPFKQAAGAMHSLLAEVRQHRPGLAGVPFWTLVIFPYTPFERESVEWHTWQVIDARALRALPISRLLPTVLRNARALLRTKSISTAGWFRHEKNEPSTAQCSELVQLLRPRFEYFESPAGRARRVDEEIKRYTEEQFEALDHMEANPRAVFAGPAGTGKTLLAIEAARRAQDAKRKVLLLCFNRDLGDWLRGQTESLQTHVLTRTINAHMLNVSGRTLARSDARDPLFWRDELPRLAIDRLLDTAGEEHVFDQLIIDEAQDLLLPGILDFLDLSLRGGLAAGRWLFFGDFEHQAIFNTSGLSLEEFRNQRGGRAPLYALRKNCRNTPRVADLARALGGLSPNYSKILRPDDGVDPEPEFYATAEQQHLLLVATLEKLKAEGLSGRDVVIISPLGDGSCAGTLGKEVPVAQRLANLQESTLPLSTKPAAPADAASLADDLVWTQRLRPYREAARHQIGYTTIQAFKGLEAPAVIVTDITRLDDETRALFYVAVTRPLRRLFVFVHDSARRDIIRSLL